MKDNLNIWQANQTSNGDIRQHTWKLNLSVRVNITKHTYGKHVYDNTRGNHI